MEVIAEEISDREIPVDEIYDEDDLRENDMVQKMLEDEREGLMDDGWGKVDEKDDEIEQLEETIAELRQEIATHKKKVAELKEWNEKMGLNRNEEWCRRCGSWDAGHEDSDRIVKDPKWGWVCDDCQHDLNNEDHEKCDECLNCKDCGCCECEEDELNSAIDASGNALY
jgi:hypothetical protein